jgi:DNA invertase Pin-like site-specific DNA recombinase
MNELVALYARVSMEETDSDSKRYQEPENQLVPLRQWVQAQGWQVYQEYVDRASGADPNRKAFNAMLADAMQRKFGSILVWRVDRFSRERMSTVLARVQKLQDRGVAVKSLTESWFDTSKDNPIAEVVLAIMAWAAAEERRKISERTKAGIQRLRNIGQWKGGRPKKRVSASPHEETGGTKENAPFNGV